MAQAAAPLRAEGHGALWWATGVLTGLGMMVALWLYTASGLLAPPWAVVALLVLWLLLAAAAVLVHRRAGAWSLLVPALAVAVWFAVLTLGEQLLGWTG